MKRKYGLIIIILLFLLSGIGARAIIQHFTFDYLYRILIKREFAINPLTEIQPDKKYQIRIWYYPFYRTISGAGTEEDFFTALAVELAQKYPNLQLKIGRLSFLQGREQLQEAIEDGEPPDLYFNFSNDVLLDRDLQIPVESYLGGEEKVRFFTLDWEKINRDHLWGWPLLVQNQSWLTNEPLTGNTGKAAQNYQELIAGLDRETLLFNFADLTLLRQLLSLRGLERFQLEKGGPGADTRRALEAVFSWLHQLREKQLFALSTLNMDDKFIEAFLKDRPVVIGPLNPWLENFFRQSGGGRYSRIELDRLIQVFSINVFRQKKYQGDDHTRAVMETARLISERYSGSLAEKMGLGPAYRETTGDLEGLPRKLLLQITPETRDYWVGVLKPVWLDFWQKGLTPAEVMSRLDHPAE